MGMTFSSSINKAKNAKKIIDIIAYRIAVGRVYSG
jgi:hypothetical protein